VAVAAVTAIGWMAAVNFMIRSDIRWALLRLAALQALGLFVALAARWAPPAMTARRTVCPESGRMPRTHPPPSHLGRGPLNDGLATDVR
jgi:hypothetical protein